MSSSLFSPEVPRMYCASSSNGLPDGRQVAIQLLFYGVMKPLDSYETYGEKLDGNYTRLLRGILNKSWKQLSHPHNPPTYIYIYIYKEYIYIYIYKEFWIIRNLSSKSLNYCPFWFRLGLLIDSSDATNNRLCPIHARTQE